MGKWVFNECSALTDVDLTSKLTEIDNYTFSECDSLTNIVIPDNITAINEYVFSGCDSLTTVTMPETLTSIGMQAFINCPSMTEVTVPAGVTEIGSLAFGYILHEDGSLIPSEGLTMAVTPDSAAHLYAVNNNITAVDYEGNPIEVTEPALIGDINLDGVISLTDAVSLNRYFANALELSEDQIKNADCYGDGKLNGADATALIRYIVRFESALPIIPEAVEEV